MAPGYSGIIEKYTVMKYLVDFVAEHKLWGFFFGIGIRIYFPII